MPQFNDHSALLLKTAIDAGITDPVELANIMGNASVETAGFSTMHERLNYSSAENLINAVKSTDDRFSMEEIRDAIASRDPQRIATMAYENRADLGNTEPGDGWRFHGRGFFQYTGRENYTKFGEKFDVDLANNPDLAADPVMAAKLAVAYWKDKVPEELRSDPEQSGAIINGGPNGAEQRVTRSQEWAGEITPELIANIRDGNVSMEQLAAMGTPGHATRPPMADGVLSERDNGQEVRDLQERLNELGYTDASGQPLLPDGDFGQKTKEAVKAFQQDHEGLTVDGIAGSNTLDALKTATAKDPAQEASTPTQPASEQPSSSSQPAQPPKEGTAPPTATGGPLLSDPTHPDHGLYEQALKGVEKLGAAAGFKDQAERERAAATLTYEAKVSGMSKIDHVVPNASGTGLFAVQGALNDPAHQRVYADKAQAAQQPVDKTTEQLSQDVPRQTNAPSQANQDQVKSMTV